MKNGGRIVIDIKLYALIIQNLSKGYCLGSPAEFYDYNEYFIPANIPIMFLEENDKIKIQIELMHLLLKYHNMTI